MKTPTTKELLDGLDVVVGGDHAEHVEVDRLEERAGFITALLRSLA